MRNYLISLPIESRVDPRGYAEAQLEGTEKILMYCTDVLCIVHCERILLLMSVTGQGGLIIIELPSDQ